MPPTLRIGIIFNFSMHNNTTTQNVPEVSSRVTDEVSLGWATHFEYIFISSCAVVPTEIDSDGH